MADTGLNALARLIQLEACIRIWQLEGFLGEIDNFNNYNYNNNNYYYYYHYNNNNNNYNNYCNNYNNNYNYNNYYDNYNNYQAVTRAAFYTLLNDYATRFIPNKQSIEITKRFLSERHPHTLVVLDRCLELAGGYNALVHRMVERSEHEKESYG